MNTPIAIPIFRTGQHVALNGVALDFTVADLQATADAYAPQVHEAPLVVGHPQLDAPAHGWVASLSVEEEILLAQPSQVEESFADLVRQGRFKKVSASFYLPDSPRNPRPGVYYLRHVGFLGAQPPAIKGLPDPAFADGQENQDTVTLEFGELAPWQPREGVLLRLRNWISQRFGAAEAETVVPESSLLSLPLSVAEAQFSEQEERLQQRERQLSAREAHLRQQRVVDFVESQVSAGRLLPAEEEHWVALLNLVSQQEAVAFGEEEEGSLAAWLRVWLAQRPVVVDYAERSAAEVQEGHGGYQVPSGYLVDARSLAMHQRILAYSRQSGKDYVTAMHAVRNSQGE